MTALEELIKLIKKLPGMGDKSASRLAYHLIKTEDSYNKALGTAIAELKDKIHPCPECGCYTEKELCDYCASPARDRSLLCVVEDPQDVLSIASSGAYNGLFHVLGGAIDPLNGIGPANLTFQELLDRIDRLCPSEIIIATNPTEEGDTTALYIQHLLKDRPGLVLSRPSSGLPIGGDLGYADKLTLSRSLRGRVKL